MKEAFGTADTETLQKKGIGSQEFVSKLTDALEKLPKALNTSRSLLDNLGDIGVRAMTAIGSVINRLVLPELKEVGEFVENLIDGGVFERLTKGLLGAFSKKDWDPVLRTAGAMTSQSPQTQLIERATGTEGKAQGTMSFLLGGDGFADFLKRALTLGVTAFMHLPDLIGSFRQMLLNVLNGMIAGVNGFVGIINAIGPKLLESLDQLQSILGIIKALLTAIAPIWVKISDFRQPEGSRWKNITPIDPAKLGDNPLSREWEKTLTDALAGFEQASKTKPEDNPMQDPSKGGFREPENSVVKAIERNTRETAASIKDALNDTFLGGGAAAKGTLSSTNLSRLGSGMPTLGNKIQQLIDEHISSILGSQLVSSTSGLR